MGYMTDGLSFNALREALAHAERHATAAYMLADAMLRARARED